MLLTAKSARHFDAARLDQSAAGRINALRLEWPEAVDQNFWALDNLLRMREGTARYEKAVERIVRRRAMMFGLVEQACVVPLDTPRGAPAAAASPTGSRRPAAITRTGTSS
jgi:hypothetical protein